MANVKCKHCGKSVSRKDAFKEEYITNTLKIANRYFCDSKCHRNFHFNESIKSDFYSKCSEILNTEITRNSYFKKKFKEIEDQDLAFLYVNKYSEELSTNFQREINRIEKQKTINLSYKIAVLINMVSDGIKMYYNEDILKNYSNDEIELEDYIDYENLMPKGKQVEPRKTIFDEGE